jgi:hypothetical protein
MPRSRKKQQPEAELQRALVQHLQLRAEPGALWFAVPNGGARSKIEAAIFKGLGVKAGVSDLLFLHEGNFFALELKAGKYADPTPAQSQFLADVIHAGGRAAWARGLDEALAQLQQWRLLRGAEQ